MSQRPQILIIDDDADIRETLQLILEVEGYDVVAASDGAEALSSLRAGLRPSLILLDLMMIGMNGYEFCESRKNDPNLCQIPLLVLTGYGTAGDAATALGVEAMNKPVELDVLLAAVRRLGGPAAVREDAAGRK